MASPQPVPSSKASDRDLASMAEARTLARRARQAQVEIAELSQERIDAIVDAMAAAVAPRGTLFLVGHRPVDPATGAATAAADQVQVSVDAATAALDPGHWDLTVAEDRPRAVAGTGVDAVIRARRRA